MMDYVRYLRSKQTIDDRALNLRVLQCFETHILKCCQNGLSTLRIVEVGAGVGAMFMRILQRNHLAWSNLQVHYTIIDIKQEVLSVARQIIHTEAAAIVRNTPVDQISPAPTVRSADISGQGVHHAASSSHDAQINLSSIHIGENITTQFVCADALHFLKERKHTFDVVIAAAVLDLWELQEALPILFAAIDEHSLLKAFYFPINFDGTTDFFPQSCERSEYDFEIEHFFHQAMGTRKAMQFDTLACHTGRRLIAILNHLRVNILSMGASSWIVSPHHGRYSADEQYFLSCIIDFVYETGKSLHDRIPRHDIDAFQRYIDCRRRQIEKAELIYVAHNIDFFGVL